MPSIALRPVLCVVFVLFFVQKPASATEVSTGQTNQQVVPVRIAVASNFRQVAQALIADYASRAGENAAGGQITLSSASSGKLFAQISHGAPFDIFLSADQQKPAALEAAGLAVKNSRLTYAEGALVAWVSRAGVLSVQERIKNAEVFTKIAIANPKFAPYGQAAIEAMQALNVDTKKSGTLVFGENIAQTYQFVQTHAVELGFVAYSQILEEFVNIAPSASPSALPPTEFWLVPNSYYSPILQDAVLLKRGQRNASAQAFYRYLRSPNAKAIIRQYGYRTPS